MIHELDILDIVSYYLENGNNVELKRTELLSIKRKIEANFVSIEVSLSKGSVERFAHKYQGCIKIVNSTIHIDKDEVTTREIVKLRSPYMEEKIKHLLFKK